MTGEVVVLSINTALLVTLVFMAGRFFQKVQDIDRRVTRMENHIFKAGHHGD